MRILLKEQYDDSRRRFLESRLETPWEIVTWSSDAGADGLREALADADAIVSMGWDASMAPAPRLRLIQLPGAGLDKIDRDAVPPGCAVCNVFEHETGIAEYVVLALLEWEIRLCRLDARLREGLWSGGWVKDTPLHGELAGKTVGFIGFGRIARATAARLAPFEVSLRACTRSPRGETGGVAVAGMDALDEMLGACHYIVVTCPLDASTRGLVDAGRLAAMRDDAVLVNVARGPIVEEEALFHACSERRIGGAVIDTWYEYPAPGRPLDEPCAPSRFAFEALDNVIMTPHASGWSAGLFPRRWSVIADNLDRMHRGEALRNVVHPATPG